MGIMFRRRKFKILVQGNYSQADVVVAYIDEPMKKTPKLEELIEKVWEEQRRRAEKRQTILFAGDLCRLIDYGERDGKLYLTFGKTDYKELMGTNIAYPVIREILGEQYMSNGTGLSAAIRTSDERLVLGQRSETLAEEAGYYHVCGGHLCPARHIWQGRLDPFSAVADGIEQEFGVAKRRISNTVCLGLAINSKTYKPGLIFYVDLDMTFKEVLGGLANAPREMEHTEIFSVWDRKQSLRSFLLANKHKIAPIGQACLWMYGIERKYWNER